jgi:hypothetical protein
MRGYWDRFVMVVLLLLVASPAMAQEKPKADDKPVAVSAITEVESLRMQIAQLLDEIAQAGEARRTVEKQRDQLRLQMVLMQSAPVREGFTYDWSVGAFRHLASGRVWDFDKKELVADDKTPKPVKADEPKPGGGGL